MKWLDAGFCRDADGNVAIIWECSDCGCQGLGGMEPPRISCPECGAVSDADNRRNVKYE